MQEEIERAMNVYDRPSITVEPPKRTTQRRGRKMVEVEEPAFVKFYTDFKAELADLDVYALKVFIYIGLSIGFENGEAWPGIRKIAKETGMDKDTAAKAIDELESKGFLSVYRREGVSNIYKPNHYFAIGGTVPSGRTVDKGPSDGPSDENAELSHENAELSHGGRVNRAQPDKQESTRQEQEEGEVSRNPLFGIYETYMGILTGKTADDIEQAEKSYGFDWVVDAISLAGKNKAKTFNYCVSVLDRWKREGKDNGRKPGNKTAAQSGDSKKYIEGEYADFIQH
jgi:Predicted transcriptional regulators